MVCGSETTQSSFWPVEFELGMLVECEKSHFFGCYLHPHAIAGLVIPIIHYWTSPSWLNSRYSHFTHLFCGCFPIHNGTKIQSIAWADMAGALRHRAELFLCLACDHPGYHSPRVAMICLNHSFGVTLHSVEKKKILIVEKPTFFVNCNGSFWWHNDHNVLLTRYPMHW